MEDADWVIPSSIFLILFLLVSKLILRRRAKHENLPPSPPALPVIGHLHLLKEPLHRSLHSLTEKYGHIFFLRLGTRDVLVVSSPSAVEECFTRNDIVFGNRPHTLAGKHLNYNYQTVGFSSYGDHWRRLRRLTALELFSSKQLALLSEVREDEVLLLVKQLFQESRGKVKVEVNLRDRLVEVSFNIMLRTLSGKRYYGRDVVAQEAKLFRSLMKEYAELLGNGNLNDFFPLLRWVDFLGLEKRMKEIMKKMDGFLQNLLEEQRRSRTVNASNDKRKMTLIDVLVSLRESEPEFYTDENVKAVVLAMLIAGSETTATTMEWAFSLLLNHPEEMQKVKDEIDGNVGQDRILNDSDISNLKYLQNVISESLRLFPVVPTLIPHESSQDCKVGGYDIPRGTMLLVNLWTLQRDPNSWTEPTKFVPERFKGEELGDDHTYDMIPFGAGRRACPGAVLAKRAMGHTLGCLIQNFDWERSRPEKLNMMEGTGLIMARTEPLVAMCTTRRVMADILSNLL